MTNLIHLPSGRRRNWPLYFCGMLAPFSVFINFEVAGLPVSLLWFFSAPALLKLRKTDLKFMAPFMLCVALLALKLPMGGSVSVLVKYSIGVVFLFLVTKFDGFESFLDGLLIGICINMPYAIYQWFVVMAGLDEQSLLAVLPVDVWNSQAWHVVLRDPNNLPRVSGFMYEPAYLAIVANILLVGEMLYRAVQPRKLVIVLAILTLLLANSRTGFLTCAIILLLSFLSKRRWRPLVAIAYVLAAVGPLLPLVFIYSNILDYRAFQEEIDISVFARYVSFVAFGQESLSNVLFGVADYTQSFGDNSVLQDYADLLTDQGSEKDPKSLLAANLFSFGVLGSFLLYALQYRAGKANLRSLSILAAANILFFNVYAYSWPLFWILVALAYDRRNNPAPGPAATTIPVQ
jgi:hypothetical protein